MPFTALEDIAGIAADWFWQTGPDGRLAHVSPNAENFLGRTIAELVATSFEAMASLDEADSLGRCREAMAQAIPFRNLLYAYQHPDGQDRWFKLSGRPMRSAEGALLGYVGVGTDVSGEQRIREALIEQNRRFNAALENMTQGLCMFGADSGLLVWNRRYTEIFGFPEGELRIGMTQRDIIARLVALGRYATGATVDSVSEGTRTSLMQNGHHAILRELADGRIIAATHSPMQGGGWVATFDDVTERLRNEAQISHMARHDALTDLPNRTALREIGAAKIAEVASGGESRLAVLCLDLDRFKPVNDTHGHAVGDTLLRAVADRLRAGIRARDFVARLGGDEFAILHRVDSLDGAVTLAQRLIASVSAPYALDGHSIEIGMSVGITLLESGPDAGAGEIDQLIKNADMALYQAKAAGRGTHCLFQPEMDQTARERHTLERELREALALGSFELHYQPLVDLTAPSDGGRGRIKGVEALVRWRHPERGLVSPGVFIPLAEETGLIVPLGEWVLRQACQDAAGWDRSVSIAVNVSPLQLRSRNFATSVLTALAVSGLQASRLELEITESVLLDDTDANLETLHTLRRLGIRISMDDFGTGYSSISYLRRFPFDKIKIDRSFVRDLGTCADSGAIIRAIVGLGASLGITTLVEGIETETQLDLVRREGADEMQGFLFSPPRPAAEITRMLDADRAMPGTETRAA